MFTTQHDSECVQWKLVLYVTSACCKNNSLNILVSYENVSITELCLHIQCVYMHISNLINPPSNLIAEAYVSG